AVCPSVCWRCFTRATAGRREAWRGENPPPNFTRPTVRAVINRHKAGPRPQGFLGSRATFGEITRLALHRPPLSPPISKDWKDSRRNLDVLGAPNKRAKRRPQSRRRVKPTTTNLRYHGPSIVRQTARVGPSIGCLRR